MCILSVHQSVQRNVEDARISVCNKFANFQFANFQFCKFSVSKFSVSKFFSLQIFSFQNMNYFQLNLHKVMNIRRFISFLKKELNYMLTSVLNMFYSCTKYADSIACIVKMRFKL